MSPVGSEACVSCLRFLLAILIYIRLIRSIRVLLKHKCFVVIKNTNCYFLEHE